MSPLPNLVYYACVARGTVIVAEYYDGSSEVRAVASKCLEKIPPFHRRFSNTAKRRMLNCLIEGSWVYCAIMDEALGKSNANAYLDQVRDEFDSFLKTRDLPLDGEGIRVHSLNNGFAPVLRHLAAPLVGIPQKEKDRMKQEMQAQMEAEEDLVLSDSFHGENTQEFVGMTEKGPFDIRSPFLASKGKGSKQDKKKMKDEVKEIKEIMIENKGKAMDGVQSLDIVVEDSTSSALATQVQRTKSKGHQLAQRMWWRSVRLVLILDAVVCLILFAIWLGICRGISCINEF
eukprot:c26994_g1_i1 orf=946-1809(+)